MIAEKTRLRRWGGSFFKVGLGLILLVGLVGFFRLPLTQYLLEQAAGSYQVPGFSAQISEISHTKLTIDKISAGDEGEITLDHLALEYDLLDLWQGGRLSIDVDGMKLSLDVTGEGPVWGTLDSLLSGGDKTGNDALPVLPFKPEITLNNSQLHISTEQGIAVLPFAAEVLGSSEDDLQGWMSFEGGKLAQHEPDELYVSALFSRTDLQIEWDVKWPEMGLMGDGAASFFLDDPGLNWNVYGDISGGVPKAFLHQLNPKVRSITGQIKLDGVGEITVAGEQPDRWRRAIKPLILGLDTASGEVRITSRSHVELTSGMALESWVPLVLSQSEGTTEVTLDAPGTFELLNLQAAEDLPPAVGELFGERISGELSTDDTQLSFSLKPSQPFYSQLSANLKGSKDFGVGMKAETIGVMGENIAQPAIDSVDLALSSESFALGQVSASAFQLKLSAQNSGKSEWEGKWQTNVSGLTSQLGKTNTAEAIALEKASLKGAFDITDKEYRVFDGEGAVRVLSARLPGDLSLSRGSDIRIQALSADILLPENDEVSLGKVLKSLSTEIKSKQLPLRLHKEQRDIDFKDLNVSVSGGEGKKWTVNSSVAELAVSEPKLIVTDLEHKLDTPFFIPDETTDLLGLNLNNSLSGQLISQNPSLELPDMAFLLTTKGSLQQTGFNGELKLVGGATLLVAKGNLDTQTRDGVVDLTLPNLLFLEGGLQPSTFSPSLAALVVESGTVSGHAELTITAGEPSGHGYLNLDISEADINEFPIKNLEGRFFFQGITEPSLPPGQSLKIEQIDVGVPLSDIELLFGAKLVEQEPLVDLRKAQLGIAGGGLALAPGTFNVLSEKQSVLLQVNRLDLAEVFTLIGREDLKGTGQMTGQIPISLEGDQVVIDKGHLATTGPGVLQIQSQVISDALASGGEQVELLIQALQNFQYTELTLDIDKPLNAAAQVKLGISGANPDVLDGHPFRLNINLETKVEPLLELLLQGQRISQGLVSDILKKH